MTDHDKRCLLVLLDLLTDGQSHATFRESVARCCARHGLDPKEDTWVSLHLRGWASNMRQHPWNRWAQDRQGLVAYLGWEAKRLLGRAT